MLLYFLLANILTGAVNLSMRTLYLSDGYAVAVLMLYSAVLATGTYLDRVVTSK